MQYEELHPGYPKKFLAELQQRMCSHFESVTDAGSLKKYFDADISVIDAKQDVWPGYQGVFVRAANVTSPSSRVAREARAGSFGLIPHWATDTKIARNTYNARVETVGSKPSFRESWKQARHFIIPADNSVYFCPLMNKARRFS